MLNKKGLIQATTRRFFYGVALLAILAIWTGFSTTNANAQSFTEGFETVPPTGWAVQNRSTTVGTTGWFQGNTAVFPAHMGTPTSYIGANFNNTTGVNTISNWLFPPSRTFNNGDVISFYTRTGTGNPFPDRLQVRLSTNGAGTNVGTTSTSVGDYTTLLLDINPNYDVGGVYPETFTQFTITLSGLPGPTVGRIAFRYFVEGGGPSGDNSNYIGIDTFSYTAATTPPPASSKKFDFDGDGKADISVFRPSGSSWFVQGSTSGFTAFNFGTTNDQIVPGDYDGDGKTDYAVFRASNSTWYIQKSTTGFFGMAFGTTNDIPAPGDFDGDGKTDLAVFRPSTGAWFVQGSTSGFTAFNFGTNNDVPIVGDYDGDGKADYAVLRPSNNTWYIQRSTAGFFAMAFGNFVTDYLVPGDYDGDGKTDLAVFRTTGADSGTWYVQGSTSGFTAFKFGLGTDLPAPADFDGDGKTDYAVFRASSGTWFIQQSTAGFKALQFGNSSDIPVPFAYVR